MQGGPALLTAPRTPLLRNARARQEDPAAAPTLTPIPLIPRRARHLGASCPVGLSRRAHAPSCACGHTSGACGMPAPPATLASRSEHASAAGRGRRPTASHDTKTPSLPSGQAGARESQTVSRRAASRLNLPAPAQAQPLGSSARAQCISPSQNGVWRPPVPGLGNRAACLSISQGQGQGVRAQGRRRRSLLLHLIPVKRCCLG